MIIRSISGVRGLTPSHLNIDSMYMYARALHIHLEEGLLFIGRDSRPSGEELLEAFANELIRLGRDVIICGIVPTPTVQFMIERSEAAGGAIITASHNPIEWNGIKFVRSDSTFFTSEDCDNLFDLADRNKPIKDSKQPGMVFPDQNSILKHSIKIVELSTIDAKAIRASNFKVVIDAVNGAGSTALPLLLEHLGCDVVKIFCEGNGKFDRGTEPLPDHLEKLKKSVIKNKADVGFAVDPDADRLAVVNEKGEPLGEEYSLVLAADGYLNDVDEVEVFVSNLSTSSALDKLAESKGSSVVRSAVGEINVVNKMNELGSKLGGEGNGGIILREAHLGRDSLVAATMVLNRMSQSSGSLSEIHQSLPQFEIVKDKVSLEGIDPDQLIKKVSSVFENFEINTLDGVKFTWPDRWVHLRKSNTEPIMRIYAEAPNKAEAENLVQQIRTCL